MQSRGGIQQSAQTTVKSPAVGRVVLQLMDLTEMVQLCFQEEVVEAKIQGGVVDSEDKISLEMDFLLWGKSAVQLVTITVTHIPAPPTPCYCCSALTHLTRWSKSSVQSRLRSGVRLPRDKGCRKEEDKMITFLHSYLWQAHSSSQSLWMGCCCHHSLWSAPAALGCLPPPYFGRQTA